MRSKCEVCVVLTALLLVPAPRAAQEILLGAQLGMSWSTFATDQGPDGHRAGIFGGGAASYALNRLLRIESGAWWVEKGAEGELQGFGPAVSFETRCRMSQDVGVLASVVQCDDQERIRTDVAVLLGAGLAWRFGRAEVLLEALYDIGLRDIGSIGAVRTRNRGSILAPRLSIPLGKPGR